MKLVLLKASAGIAIYVISITVCDLALELNRQWMFWGGFVTGSCYLAMVEVINAISKAKGEQA